MRQDIYVVQKTAEEGKELEEWCIENHIPISSSRFGFDESWKLFIWYQTLQNGFIANQNIKINKQDLTQVTIEEFKRLQLESLGKTEELKIGDWVLIKLDQFDSLGEGGKFNDKKGVPLRIEEISNRCICKLSGIHCILSFDRFEKCEKPSSDLKSEFIVGKWYKILDNWWAKFKTVHNSGNRWQFSEHIDKNGAYSNIIQSIDVISEIKLLTDLSEIQEYLPDGHIDKQIQTNTKQLLEDAKILYPIGTRIYQLYAGGTSNKSHEITIHNHDFTIDSDGEVLYNGQYRLYTPINDTWATKVEEQPKYEVVHCKTQEEWDFVIKTEKITKLNSKTFKQNEKECIVLKALKYQSDIHTASSHKWLSENNAKIYTFEEWCNNNGYSFEPVKKSVEGHFYIKLKNQKELDEIIKYFENVGYTNSNQKTVFGDKYFIVYPEYRKFQLLALDCGYPEKQWVFESSNKLVPKIGEYYFKSDFIFIHVDPINYKCNNTALDIYNKLFHFKNAAMDIWNKNPERLATQEEKEWLNKCIKAGRFVEKDEKPINFGGLNLEDWLRETKKLNLSLEELDKHISSGVTCHFDNVYSWLNGIGSLEKAEILWNEWNKPGIDKKDFIVSIPDEWGQNKYVIGIDPYNLIEEFKPNTQATLIPVKQKQIFKN